MRLEAFVSFHIGCVVISRLMEGILVFSSWKNNFLFKKIASAYSLCVSTRIESSPFKWRMRCHPEAKPIILSCF